MQKFISAIKPLEIKIKNLEESYEKITLKNERLLQELQDKEKFYRTREIELENQISKLKS